MAVVALLYPGNNWDVIGYATAAMSLKIKDDVQLHSFVYEGLRQAVPESIYPEYVRPGYQATLSQDPEALRQVKVWYQIRPAYVLPVYWLVKAGFDPFLATHIAAVTAVFIGLWIFYLTVSKRADPIILLSLPLFVLVLGVFEVARISTPDGLAFLTAAAVFYYLLKNHWIVLLILPLSLLVRTDLLIFNLIILGYLFFTHKKWRIWIFASGISNLLVVWGINVYYGHYGYAALFWTTFVENLAYPAETAVTLTLAEYRQALFKGLLDIIYFKEFLIYLTLLVLAGLLYYRLRLGDQTAVEDLKLPLTIAFLAFASVIIHFLIFPAIWSRFFSGQYFIGAVTLLLVLSASVGKLR